MELGKQIIESSGLDITSASLVGVTHARLWNCPQCENTPKIHRKYTRIDTDFGGAGHRPRRRRAQGRRRRQQDGLSIVKYLQDTLQRDSRERARSSPRATQSGPKVFFSLLQRGLFLWIKEAFSSPCREHDAPSKVERKHAEIIATPRECASEHAVPLSISRWIVHRHGATVLSNFRSSG